jgi:uncharacterized protein with HEPN domain
MARSDREWADDILAAITDIRHDTVAMDLKSFAASPVVVRSVLYSIGVIGEASKRLGDEFKLGHPGIPWRAIASMRDRVVHEYFRTSVNRIWDIVTDDLDPLEASLRAPPPTSDDGSNQPP